MKRWTLVVLGLIFSVNLAAGQTQRCLTTPVPDRSQFESWIAQVQLQRQAQRSAATTTYNIPVVVHVIHNGEVQGTGSNISPEQIQSQLDVLNEDFNRLNPDTVNTPSEFLGVAGKLDIQFLPALIGPSGDTLTEAGIHRVDRNGMFTAPPYTSAYIDANIKPATIWDPDKYFNIWVLDFQEALGYAQFPDPVPSLPDITNTNNANTDGVVVRYTAFGTTGNVSSPWNGGRTTTHETGHWLGLYHIWGPNDLDPCNFDDFVIDTPNQDGPTNNCPGTQGPTCTGVALEMWQNYMDFTFDNCMNIFTLEQANRMSIVIENAPRRALLLTSTVAEKFDQQITFAPLGNVPFNDPDFQLTASSTSGLPIVYSSSDTNVATVAGNVVTITGVGSTILTADQAGNDFYHAATAVQQQLTVVKADQSISFDVIPSLTFLDGTYILSATASSGLKPVFSSSDDTIAQITGDTLTILAAGQATITADQPGDNNYNPAAPVEQILDIQKADQVISFDPLGPVAYGSVDFPLEATASSGLTVGFVSSNIDVATVIGNVISVSSAGETTIKAFQGGDNNYKAADTVSRVLTVNKAIQVVTFDTIATKRFGDPDFTLHAESDSGLPVTLFESSENAILSIQDSMASITGVGMVELRAIQAGDQNYLPDTSIQNLTVDKGIQTWIISGGGDYQDTLDVLPLDFATSAGLPVTIDSIAGPLHFENDMWLSDGTGRVSIFVRQPGDVTFEASDTTVGFCLLPSPVIKVEPSDSATLLLSNYVDGNVWYRNDEIVSTSPSIEAVFKDTYKLEVTLDNCTQSISQLVIPTATGKDIQDGDILVFPNPVKNVLTIDLQGMVSSNVSAFISDIHGRPLTTYLLIHSSRFDTDVSPLKPGLYLLNIVIGEKSFHIRFVKE